MVVWTIEFINDRVFSLNLYKKRLHINLDLHQFDFRETFKSLIDELIYTLDFYILSSIQIIKHKPFFPKKIHWQSCDYDNQLESLLSSLPNILFYSNESNSQFL